MILVEKEMKQQTTEAFDLRLHPHFGTLKELLNGQGDVVIHFYLHWYGMIFFWIVVVAVPLL
jgi:predicted dehydrogenase